MLNKIKLSSCLMALVLFAFPWLDIQCSEKSLATQNGFQVITGAASPLDENERPSTGNKNDDDSLGTAPLVGIALLTIIGALACSLIALVNGNRTANTLSSILPAIALGLLLLQLMIGFPAKQSIRESISKASTDNASVDDPFSDMGESMAVAMMSNIQIKTKPAFYLELLSLGIPSLLLANSFANKIQKNKPGNPPGLP